MNTILAVLGTRPDAIKMVPVINELKKTFKGKTIICSTTQHDEMLSSVLDLFKIKPDHELNIFEKGQSLNTAAEKMIHRFGKVLMQTKPDAIIVQGDTLTSAIAAMSAFYHKIPVYHVEAGLRSHDMQSPWPEEMHRRFVSLISALHFAPTQMAADALLQEGIAKEKVIVTGNTVIDVLHQILSEIMSHPTLLELCRQTLSFLDRQKKLIVVTSHRRENIGKPLTKICAALNELSKRDDVDIVYPVHLNENVRNIVFSKIRQRSNIHLIDPLGYVPFVYLMKHAYVILTDSGGIQEEAPALNIPVLVLRRVTERPEAIETGAARLVGDDSKHIIDETNILLDNMQVHDQMSHAENPFGDGHASRRIVEAICGAHHVK